VAFTADGFYRTGDLVRRHPSGNLVVEGRSKDLINRGGREPDPRPPGRAQRGRGRDVRRRMEAS